MGGERTQVKTHLISPTLQPKIILNSSEALAFEKLTFSCYLLLFSPNESHNPYLGKIQKKRKIV
jgi:hypothetical protein